MKVVVVAVRDQAMNGAFARPIFVPTVGVAIRSFTDEVNRADRDNPMHQHPEDYELWSLAVFDEETGQFEEGERKMLVRGKEVVSA